MKKILVWLGWRSRCCGAKTYEPVGWDRLYCSKCQKRVDVIEEESKKAELGEVWAPSKWDVFVDNIMLLIILGALAVLAWKVIGFVEAMNV